nr:protein FAM189A2-like [Chelonoidis abingdonii]
MERKVKGVPAEGKKGEADRAGEKRITGTAQQVTESSLGERNTTAGFSTQVSVDSTSLMVSEVADIPDHSYSSEDLYSLEVQGSLHSTDFSPYNTIHKGATNRSCTSLDHSICSGFHRTNSQCSPDEDGSSCSRASVDRSRGQDYENYVHGRASDCSSENFSPSERESQSSVRENKTTPPLKQVKICFGVFNQPAAVHTQPSPCSVPASTSSRYGCPERTVQQHCIRKYGIPNIVRSTSDPVSCSSSMEVPVSSSHVAASACQDSVSCFPRTGKQRETRKIDLQLKPKAFNTISKERPHSLVDLKAYKDTKILVAKFLEHSNCNLPPEVRHVVNSIRSVIKSDERHMEEAIFSANIIDQVITSSQQNVNTSRKRLQEDLHLQSCGALSSPVAFLRRSHITRSLERNRPHSLIGVCRETIL